VSSSRGKSEGRKRPQRRDRFGDAAFAQQIVSAMHDAMQVCDSRPRRGIFFGSEQEIRDRPDRVELRFAINEVFERCGTLHLSQYPRERLGRTVDYPNDVRWIEIRFHRNTVS